TIHLFVTQIVNGNFAVARLEEFTDKQFSEAAYCNARGRLVAGQVGDAGAHGIRARSRQLGKLQGHKAVRERAGRIVGFAAVSEVAVVVGVHVHAGRRAVGERVQVTGVHLHLRPFARGPEAALETAVLRVRGCTWPTE